MAKDLNIVLTTEQRKQFIEDVCRPLVEAARALAKPKPFLKWVGGKRQLLPELRKEVPLSFRRYYEPFLGGGALFFDLRASGWTGPATLGDTNDRLIRTYRGVRDNVEDVIGLLGEMKYNRNEYLTRREDYIDARSDPEVAAWFIYINKCGFNGLYRVNKSGVCNVPFGRYTDPVICDVDTLRLASKALRNTILRRVDFERCVESVAAGDLVYFDPPYWPASESANFTGYTKGGFSSADQERLRDHACGMRMHRAHVILSNADVPAIRKLYRGFNIRRVNARRNVNSKASKRGPVGEVIIT